MVFASVLLSKMVDLLSSCRLQKLPATPLKSHDTITENELWSTYYDPVLSCLVSDPDELVHLCWTNSLPNENGKTRPDAIISE